MIRRRSWWRLHLKVSSETRKKYASSSPSHLTTIKYSSQAKLVHDQTILLTGKSNTNWSQQWHTVRQWHILRNGHRNHHDRPASNKPELSSRHLSIPVVATMNRDPREPQDFTSNDKTGRWEFLKSIIVHIRKRTTSWFAEFDIRRRKSCSAVCCRPTLTLSKDLVAARPVVYSCHNSSSMTVWSECFTSPFRLTRALA